MKNNGKTNTGQGCIHIWYLNRQNVGICRCGQIRQFPKLKLPHFDREEKAIIEAFKFEHTADPYHLMEV